MHSNTRCSDVQVVENEACSFSFDLLYRLICRDLAEPAVYSFSPPLTPSAILLYLVVHKLPSFLEFVASKADYDFLPDLLRCSSSFSSH